MFSALSWNSTLHCKTGVLIAKNPENAKFFRSVTARRARLSPGIRQKRNGSVFIRLTDLRR
jgi:hypothetical protein